MKEDEMTSAEENRKDMAEFFRFALEAGLCDVSIVVGWADSIIETEEAPHISFIELSISLLQPSSTVQTLLADVPGESSPEMSVRLLLGHAFRLLKAGAFSAEQLLLRIYGISSLHTFPEGIYFELVRLEDEYSLVRDGVYGTLPEIDHDVFQFLAEYESNAPDIPAQRCHA